MRGVGRAGRGRFNLGIREGGGEDRDRFNLLTPSAFRGRFNLGIREAETGSTYSRLRRFAAGST